MCSRTLRRRNTQEKMLNLGTQNEIGSKILGKAAAPPALDSRWCGTGSGTACNPESHKSRPGRAEHAPARPLFTPAAVPQKHPPSERRAPALCGLVVSRIFRNPPKFFCVFPLGQKSWCCRPCKAAGTQKRTGSSQKGLQGLA